MAEKPCLTCKTKVKNRDGCYYRKCRKYIEWFSYEWRNIRRAAEEVRDGRRKK